MGLSEGCVMRRAVAKDEVIRESDVEKPDGRLSDALWREQRQRWPASEPPVHEHLAPEGVGV
jgi:predicted homoserine dehydrogenase-like protein